MKRSDILAQFAAAREGGYALGSFSPRNTVLIPAIILIVTIFLFFRKKWDREAAQ